MIKTSVIGKYSLTNYQQAEIINEKIIEILKIVSTKLTILDITSGIGGNVIPFALKFGKVIAIEYDKETFDILSNNVITAYKLNNVTLKNQDGVQSIYDEEKYDVLFMDPPWGGRNYTEYESLSLQLNRTNIINIIETFLMTTKVLPPKLIVIKVPYNYNFLEIEQLKSISTVEIIDHYKVGKNIILFKTIYMTNFIKTKVIPMETLRAGYRIKTKSKETKEEPKETKKKEVKEESKEIKKEEPKKETKKEETKEETKKEKSKEESKKVTLTFPVGVCVGVKHLRPKSDNLREWMAKSGNILVLRRGRVFIKDKSSGESKVFTYKESPWANPFQASKSKYTLEEALEKFTEHLDKLLENPKTRKDFLELRNAKELGCFCEPGEKCHRDIIIKKLKKLLSKTPPEITILESSSTK